MYDRKKKMYIKRNYEKTIASVSKSFPCIVVYGPRQVGKSTVIDHLFGGRFRTITLDDVDDRALAIQNPKMFLELNPWPLIIDEIQKAPNLLDEIKKKIDEQRLLWLKSGEERQLMYILTGSNRFELQEGISESLAGRCGVIEMSSFSMAEKTGYEGLPFDPIIENLISRERNLLDSYRTRPEIFDEIFKGGMPDIVTGVSERDAYFRAYLNTYIEKDVRKLINADMELQFRNFLSLIALRTAQELHYDVLANSVGIDTRTCKRWISILETSGIIFLLQPYMPNMSSRIIKAPKLYFMDTGFCAYLCRWPDAGMLESCAMGGAFFETFVISELVKNFYSNNIDPKGYLFYYRDIDQKEIDVLFVRRDEIYPIEIKKGISPKNPTKNFGVLSKYGMAIKTGLIIDTCDRIRPANDISYYYPVSLLGL